MSFRDFGFSTKPSGNSIIRRCVVQKRDTKMGKPSPAQASEAALLTTLVTFPDNNYSPNSELTGSTRFFSVGGKQRSRVTFADDVESKASAEETVTDRSGSISNFRRGKPKPKSTFSILVYETQQYQKLVADLEAFTMLNPESRDAIGECPEATWRARILMRSAQDADNDLSTKLDAYERSLSSLVQGTNNDDRTRSPAEIRMAYTSCQKLRRDFDRSHKVLVASLTLYEKRQQAEVNQLKAVGWISPKSAQSMNRENSTDKGSNAKVEDFFDQAMRQRDLERIQISMEKVNSIYQDLAHLVNSQQDNVDKLEKEVNHSATNVDAAARNIHCFYQRRMNPLVGCGIVDTDDHQPPSFLACLTTFRSVAERVQCTPSHPAHPMQRFDSTITFSEPRKKTDTVKYSANEQEVKQCFEDEDANSVEESYEGIDYGSFIRVSEPFHWLMPFETFREDIVAVHDDIVSAGKDVVLQAGKGLNLNCGAIP